MDIPARPDDVLAQPTRASLFSLLGELRRPAGTEELADRLDLHPNGVRVHLERLHEAGLVERERIRQPRGRPRDMWTVAPDARPGGAAPSGYEQLGQWLARALSSSRAGSRTVEATGREIGRELAPDHDGPPQERMQAVLVSLGFQPRHEASSAGAVTYHLCNCPYRDAASESPEVVCGLHRGMTRGLLDVIAPTAKLTGFVPNDPYQAGCRIELAGGLAPEGSSRQREPA